MCQHVLQTEDDDDVPLQCLSDLASSVPKTLTPHLNDIFTMCSTTVANTEKDDSYRHSSLEVMVALCESSPNVIRKRAAAFIPTLSKFILRLVEPTWSTPPFKRSGSTPASGLRRSTPPFLIEKDASELLLKKRSTNVCQC